MPVKTIVWIVALVIGAALLIVVGSAILACLRAGRHRDDAASIDQAGTVSGFPQVNSTEIFLDAYGAPTGAVSTSSTSTLPPDSSASNGSGHGEPEPEGLSLSDEERTMSQEPRQGTGKDSKSLVNLRIQILDFRAVVDVSRRSLSRQKSCGEEKSRCA